MEIIPAIDIIGGKCVRLRKGDYGEMTPYSEDPVAVAREFSEAGIKRCHLVDLDGAKANKIMNLPILHIIAYNADLIVDFGGGLKDLSQVEIAFQAGADMVTGGSIAANDTNAFLEWLDRYGPGRIILGADVLDGQVMTDGWKKKSDFTIDSLLDFYTEKGIQYVICTDISKDGTMEGPAFELYDRLMNKYPDISLIASGGVSKYDDLLQLKEMGLYGAIVGKAYYEGAITLEQMASLC